MPVEEKKKGQREKVTRNKPLCVAQYNKYMNGVDRMDQRIAYYPFARRTLRWSLKFGMYLFQLCFANAFVVYRAKGGRLKTLLEFTMSVIEAWTAARAPVGLQEVEGAVGGEEEAMGGGRRTQWVGVSKHNCVMWFK